MRVLGIETSCDDTGVAIYDSKQGLLAHSLYSQISHLKYGGVVPELASRDHVRKTLPLIQQTLDSANLTLPELDGIAYTAGPGLVGALLVGASLGRSLAYALDIPAIAVNHLEAHLLAAMLEQEAPTFPFVTLLVSGGHTLLVKVQALGQYELLGESLDDAAGEAFDKTAKLLGLPYPGGAALAKLAEQGTPGKFHFPRPMLDRPNLNFSFSGLKTAVVEAFQQTSANLQTKADIAHAFQQAVVETLVVKCRRALQKTGLNQLVLAGGVAANQLLRTTLKDQIELQGGKVYYPRPAFCTDNGAMVAYAGCLRLQAGESESLAIKVRVRWPLDEVKGCGQVNADKI